ncbi:MAG: helix-turn-helix domain-containing protein [Thermoanaerobaculia bacterium]
MRSSQLEKDPSRDQRLRSPSRALLLIDQRVLAELVSLAWGTDYVAESNVVDRHIRNLRIKLQDPSRRPRYIVTVPAGISVPAPFSGLGLTARALDIAHPHRSGRGR